MLAGETLQHTATTMSQEQGGAEVEPEEAADQDTFPLRVIIKNVLLIALCWSFGIAAAFTQISTTTLAAKDLNGASTSTVPLGSIMVVSAAYSFFLPKVDGLVGLRRSYLLAAFAGMVGAGISVGGVIGLSGTEGFIVLVVGALPQGLTYATTNSFRNLVVDFSGEKYAANSVATVVGGGILSALIGPELSKYTRTALEAEYGASYILLLALYTAQFVTLCFVDFGLLEEREKERDAKGDVENGKEEDENRSWGQIVSTREYITAVGLQVISYTAMGALMTATPLAMRDEGFSFDESTSAITGHMLGMFVPSLISGRVTKALKPLPTGLVGFLLLLLGALVFYINRGLGAFISGITLVGVGWNFSFIPTVTLYNTKVCRPREKRRVQGTTDLAVVGGLALVVFASGFLFEAVGWDVFVAIFSGYIGIAVFWTAYTFINPGGLKP